MPFDVVDGDILEEASSILDNSIDTAGLGVGGQMEEDECNYE
jgi:hypothetical protein